MTLTPMRYKDFVWPHNPRTYTIRYERQVAVHKVPFGRYAMQDLGMGRRIMEGEGEFWGPDAYDTFKELGFSTELDDFGSGYSSLVSLNTLPLDVMKLDMSMVRKATELNDFRIVESTINLEQVLGLRTVVEGVETADEARRVTDFGCDYIQGYYYSKPLASEEFEDYLRRDAAMGERSMA